MRGVIGTDTGILRSAERTRRDPVRTLWLWAAVAVVGVVVAAAASWGVVYALTADAIEKSRSLVSQGRNAEAESELRLALAARPENRALMLELARVRSASGNVPGAIDAYRTVLRRGPDAPIAYELAMLERLAGRTADAARDLEAAAASDPANVAWSDDLAKTLLELGRKSEAIAVWSRIASSSSQPRAVRRDMYVRIGTAKWGAGDTEGARAAALAALALVPGDPQAQTILKKAR